MNNFLHILGGISLVGGAVLAVGSLPNIGASLWYVVSGVMFLAAFWWMADVRSSVEDAADSLAEAVDLLKAQAKQSGALPPDALGKPAKKP